MVVKRKASNLEKSIQAKIDKLKRERKASNKKEPQSIDIICTSEDIARTSKKD